jgi:DNA-binding response OmpR family regulator
MAATVLVVDDERDLVELLTWNLQAAGHEVVAAFDGLDGLHKARKHLPDLILLDLLLPDLDGFSICEILRCQPSTAGIPVILLTAMRGELPRLHGFEVGATDYCSKPVPVRDLMARVEAVLNAAVTKAQSIQTNSATSLNDL